MDREEIKKILPHRDNMLLLDEVAKEDDVAIGHYTVRGDEFFFKRPFSRQSDCSRRDSL